MSRRQSGQIVLVGHGGQAGEHVLQVGVRILAVPLAYLCDVLTRLPQMTTRDDLSALTPANWKPA